MYYYNLKVKKFQMMGLKRASDSRLKFYDT